MKASRRLALLLSACASLALFSASALKGAPASAARPEDVGLSSDRLRRIDETIQSHIDAGDIAGAVTLVARRDRVAHFEAHGLLDRGSAKPMTKDAIFRLASMTKPITTVAIMLLFEEGKLRLSDPVSRFIPEFKHVQVAAPDSAPTESSSRAGSESGPIKLVPASREVTIRDLLTHTSGIGSRGPSESKLPQRKPAETLADFVPRLASAPLDFQPGTAWSYSPSAGMDILGRIVEVVSGITFDQFLKLRIFDPLGMRDTGFTVKDARTARLAVLYRRTRDGLEAGPGRNVVETVYFSGGGGLAGTAEDYLQFAQMLLGGGEWNGKRLLSPKTVELMASNHVGNLYAIGCAHKTVGPCDFYDHRGMGFGLGVDVVRDSVAAGIGVSNGAFGWAGAFGTRMWVDPKERMITILMVTTRVVQVQRDFEYAVRQALLD